MATFNLKLNSENWTSKLYTNDIHGKTANNLYKEASNIILVRPSDFDTFKNLPAVQKPFLNQRRRLERYPDCPGVSISSDLLTHCGLKPKRFTLFPNRSWKESSET
jgi:hypothetical protein